MIHWLNAIPRAYSSERFRRSTTIPLLCLLGAAVILLLLPSATAEENPTGPLVLQLRIDGDVEPILAAYIDEGLADAAKRNAALALITMDTPGGLSDSMKDMIQHILVSKVPVAVYVSPTGARGASAGFYILLSADIAAMAPGTHAGAASPVLAIGGYVPQIDEVLRRKINNDAMAFLRSFTERRGRNPVLAETAITESKAFTEKEALDGKMIDFGKEMEVNTRSLVLELLDFVDDVVDELGCREDLQYVHKILEHGTGADRQLAVYEQNSNFADVVDYITSQTLKGT